MLFRSKGKKEFTIEGALHNPGAVLRQEFVNALNEAGISVKEERDEEIFSVAKVLTETSSPALKDIIAVMLKKSDNSYADCLMRQVGIRYLDKGSLEGGIESYQHFWKGRGIPLSGWFQQDGSGLSRANGITTQQLALITAKAKPTHRELIKDGLKPMADIPGLYVKSGYINRVRAYTGFIEKEGKEYAFAIISNNHDCSASAMRKKIEKLMTKVQAAL